MDDRRSEKTNIQEISNSRKLPPPLGWGTKGEDGIHRGQGDLEEAGTTMN